MAPPSLGVLCISSLVVRSQVCVSIGWDVERDSVELSCDIEVTVGDTQVTCPVSFGLELLAQ